MVSLLIPPTLPTSYLPCYLHATLPLLSSPIPPITIPSHQALSTIPAPFSYWLANIASSQYRRDMVRHYDSNHVDGDPLTNVTAKSTQTNGGTSPDSVSSQEPLATRPITTTTTISTASTSIVSTNYKPAREESTNTQTHTHTDAPHTSSKSTESAPDIDKRQVTSQEQERVCKEKERQVDAEREKAAKRKRERERCYSRGPVWQSNQPGSSNTQPPRPSSHHPPPYGTVQGPVSSYRLSPCLPPPHQNPHSMFSAASVRPQTPLTSTALPMPTQATPNANPFGAESGPNFSYSKGNQQQELIQELNSRFIHNQQSMTTYPPLMPLMRETHMHQHMHQHQHTHAFVPPAPIAGNGILPLFPLS
ncbi:hypothetical protein BSL78_12467, partial [Apostichopus japonicus]